MDEYEKAFQTVTSVVFGKALSGHRDYEPWLSRNVSDGILGKSKQSGEEIPLPPFGFYHDIRHNIATMEEAYNHLGKMQLAQDELEALDFSGAKDVVAKLATTTPCTEYGENSRMEKCSLYYSSHNCLNSSALNCSKSCLYSFWPRHSEFVLGSYYLFSSRFCIKCYNSENLTRCFQMSDCNSCSDSLFCHNCENVHESMFCFNSKNLRYAIGNVEIGQERFKALKALILAQIIEELEKTKNLRFDIFNIGSGGRKLWHQKLMIR